MITHTLTLHITQTCTRYYTKDAIILEIIGLRGCFAG